MATYRFIGDIAHARLGDKLVSLTVFGQSVDLAPEHAKILLESRVPILTDEEFRTAGFTDKELQSYPTAASQESAPASFKTRKMRLVEMFLKSIGVMPADPPESADGIATSEEKKA